MIAGTQGSDRKIQAIGLAVEDVTAAHQQWAFLHLLILGTGVLCDSQTGALTLRRGDNMPGACQRAMAETQYQDHMAALILGLTLGVPCAVASGKGRATLGR